MSQADFSGRGINIKITYEQDVFVKIWLQKPIKYKNFKAWHYFSYEQKKCKSSHKITFIS